MAQDNEDTKNLATARESAVTQRRQLAVALGEPYKRGHTENMRDAFVAVQALIEAIDRAITDERHIENMRPRSEL
jgi:hypothetical protein